MFWAKELISLLSHEKISLFLLLNVACFMSISAQKLSVESFAIKANDLTARTQARQDVNGIDCALVKVQLAASGATFSGNVVGDVKYNTSEYWVYIPQGSKRLNIRLEGYLPLEVNFEDYEVKPLESKAVYVMVVSGITTSPSIEAPRIKTGWIILDSKPQGASVFINDEFVGNTPLTNYKQAYGTYSYRVEHPNYHPSTGTLELNDGKLEKKIELKPAFGSIAITCSITGANILLDGKATNKVTPCTLEEVPSGRHTITIQKDKYSPRQQSVNVEDGQTAQLSISLDARFAQVSITSIDGAQIYCNGKQIGTSKHVEDMMEGYYDIEARMEHHNPVSKQIQVMAGEAQEITLKPTPIYGSLDITSTPHDADVTIDGKHYGKTPLTIEQLLEGKHEVIISKDGYIVETHVLQIEENKGTIVNVELKEMKEVIISLKEGESLHSKLEELTFPISQLIIKGNVDLPGQDWKALSEACRKWKFEKIDLHEMVGLKTIPRYAFANCTSLTSTVITNSVTNIGDGAFDGCTGLTSITIPNSVTTIVGGAFSGCTGLTSISVEKGTTYYDSRDNCNAIIQTKNNKLIVGCKTTVIPNSVTNIGYRAFDGCTGLTSITIPNSVTSIGIGAFDGCTGLTSIAIPNGVTDIEDRAFGGCTGLTSITIPNSVTNIGYRAFGGCTGLTSITIPNSVTSIGMGAFDGCTSLTSVVIPKGTVIGSGAFEGCPNLKITRR